MPHWEFPIRFGEDQFVELTNDESQPFGPWNRLVVPVIVTDGVTSRVCGSAWFICPGVVLTARHVLDEHVDRVRRGELGLGVLFASDQRVPDQPEGPWYVFLGVEGVSMSSEPGGHDLALLTTAIPFIGETMASGLTLPLTFARPREGVSVMALGYPQAVVGEPASSTSSLTIGALIAAQGTLREVHAPRRDGCVLTFPVFRSDYPSPHGMSGGPIVAEHGYVCGAVASAYDTEGDRLSYGSLLAPALNLSTPEGQTLYDLCEAGEARSDGSHRLYRPTG